MLLKYAVPDINESLATLKPPSVYSEAVDVNDIAFEASEICCGAVKLLLPVVAS
jgi:hypothetical protein